MDVYRSAWSSFGAAACVLGLGLVSEGCAALEPEEESAESTESAYSAGMIPGPVKWHPGHYATVMTYQTKVPGYMEGLYKELEVNPAMRGIQVRFLWSELEKERENYTFGAIDKYLSELSARGKRLVIQV